MDTKFMNSPHINAERQAAHRQRRDERLARYEAALKKIAQMDDSPETLATIAGTAVCIALEALR